MSTMTHDLTGEPSLFSGIYHAASETLAQIEERERAWQTARDARSTAEAIENVTHDAPLLFGEHAPPTEAWRGYPDHTAVAYLGSRYWLRWHTDPDARTGQHGTFALIAPCGRRGFHETDLDELPDVLTALANATRCVGNSWSGCRRHRHEYPL